MSLLGNRVTLQSQSSRHGSISDEGNFHSPTARSMRFFYLSNCVCLCNWQSIAYSTEPVVSVDQVR